MKSAVLASLPGMLLAGLAGCTQQSAETVHSVEWYQAHKAERQAKNFECRHYPGQFENRPNYVNARAALDLLTAVPTRRTVHDQKRALDAHP